MPSVWLRLLREARRRFLVSCDKTQVTKTFNSSTQFVFPQGRSKQRGDIASRDGASLLRLASEPPIFFMHVGAEDFVFLPTGFLYTVLTMRDAKGVRWSFSPVNETITETTRRSLAASMDAYASLRATKYKEFYDFLDNSR